MSVRYNRKLAVDIARDVLAQLKLNRFIAATGTYCRVNDENGYENSDELEGQCFQRAFKEKTIHTCRVCGIGSMFVSLANLKNEINVEKVNNPQFDAICKRLADIFPKKELLLIEYVFEQGCMGKLSDRTSIYGIKEQLRYSKTISFTKDELSRAIKFGDRYAKDNARLRAIMLNIIRNKGHFILPQRVSAAKAAV